MGRSRGLGFAEGRGGPAAYDIRVIGVLPPRDAGAIRLHGLGAAGLSADERRRRQRVSSTFKENLIWPCPQFGPRVFFLRFQDKAGTVPTPS